MGVWIRLQKKRCIYICGFGIDQFPKEDGYSFIKNTNAVESNNNYAVHSVLIE